MLFSTAYSSAGQFRNDGSTTFTRVSVSAPAASTQCQIGPRQPSTRPVACAPARSGPGAANTAPGAARAGDAAGHEGAGEQRMAGQPRVEPQQPLAQPEAVRVAEGVARVVHDHADVADMVVEALQLEQHDAKPQGALRRVTARQRLQRLAERQRVTDARVAGDALGELRRAGQRQRLEELLRALVD